MINIIDLLDENSIIFRNDEIIISRNDKRKAYVHLPSSITIIKPTDFIGMLLGLTNYKGRELKRRFLEDIIKQIDTVLLSVSDKWGINITNGLGIPIKNWADAKSVLLDEEKTTEKIAVDFTYYYNDNNRFVPYLYRMDPKGLFLTYNAEIDNTNAIIDTIISIRKPLSSDGNYTISAEKMKSIIEKGLPQEIKEEIKDVIFTNETILYNVGPRHDNIKEFKAGYGARGITKKNVRNITAFSLAAERLKDI